MTAFPAALKLPLRAAAVLAGAMIAWSCTAAPVQPKLPLGAEYRQTRVVQSDESQPSLVAPPPLYGDKVVRGGSESEERRVVREARLVLRPEQAM